MKRNKLLMQLSYYSPNLSGLTIYARSVAEYMVNQGYEVTVLTSKFDKTLKDFEVINSVKVKRCNGFRLGKGFIMPTFFWESRKLVSESDVVNCHLPSIESWWMGFWAKIYKKKLVVTYHCYFDSGNPLLNKIIEHLQNLCCNWAEKIVVNSKDYIEGYGLLKQFGHKIEEVYPPVEVEKTENKRQKTNKKVIGFLGRISHEKNIEILIEAVPLLKKRLNSFLILLAGSDKVIGEEKYRQKIIDLCSQWPEIRIVGQISSPADFFESCDCLVLPSKNKLESFGMVSAESILCGTPVIASDIPGVRVPVLASGGGEIFDPESPADLADKIIKVLSYKEFKPKKEVFDKFKTLKFYDQLFR